ncbi:MAG TPA: hypothetical protein VGT79_08465 [Xanthomonadaceae bacterium]|nr:hypothetical protein [Xanthomonadaceae bacterium]
MHEENRMSVASSLQFRVLLLLWLAFTSTVACAKPSRIDLPEPAGLVACAPKDPQRQMLQSMSLLGEPIGCFHSAERIRLHGVPRDVSEPLETAFALNVSPAFGPYSSSDVRTMFLKVSEQWKNYKPLNHQVRPEYEQQVNAIIARSLPNNAPPVNVKLEPPILASIERLGNDSYMVVSIRQRRLQLADDVVVSTAVDSTAITIRNGALIRLSLARELRGPTDISIVHEATAAWLARVVQATKGH